ncbi:MerR family transcriptional regulator [Actinoallomurus rhizosphaericola]|uniref:MerR family transcriptional regulator n=1 Tax=Actinoallomurus rhizosphaericola TaxID=2952536 RepID=UPI002092468F|nr:MerR family transcriptional regulator [Actinoallomurus rhizosphaericola]MCO5997815.1 MerR family transcriptional regulator [Actinoallomurus rhizosphaericola]
MRISQLAERSGVPATTLRFYETAGLLPADRTPAGYRVYGQDAIERLSFIDAAKHLGLPLEEIAGLLAVWESGACADVKAGLRPRVAARLAEAERRIAELTAFTGTLHRALAHLDALPDRAGRCDPGCGFLGPAAPTAPPPSEPFPRPAPEEERPPRPEAEAEHWRGAPVACSLTGPEVTERAAHWQRVLTGAEHEPIDDGVRLTLPAEHAAELAALAAEEQRCCPFFDFRLHLNGAVAHLEVRAPADGAALLTDLFGAAT